MRGALWVSIVWGVSFVVSGCAGVRGRADTAFEHGDYVGAADQYGALAERSPQDARLRARRDDARSRALIVLAIRASKLRAAGRQEPALATLADLLSRGRAWREVNSDAAEQAISGEIAAAGAYLHGQIRGLVAGGEVLAAEEAITARRGQLGVAKLEPLWPSLIREVHEAGDATLSCLRGWPSTGRRRLPDAELRRRDCSALARSARGHRPPLAPSSRGCSARTSIA